MKKLELNVVSACCAASVIEGQQVEFPLGGHRWGITNKATFCEKCEMPCETAEACGICGEIGCANDCEVSA